MRQYNNELAKIRYKGNLTRQEEQSLLAAAKAGDINARNTLVERNLPFARQYATKFMNDKVTKEDLISAAHLGLINAVEKYDPTSNVKFITYAVYQLKAAIFEELKVNQAVYVPTGQKRARFDSLDANVPGTDDLCGVDLLESYFEPTDTLAMKGDLLKRMRAYLEKCDERTRDILDAYYQLWNPFADLESVGTKYDLSREGIRRVKNITLNKMYAEMA